jgi:hypothetical protein
MLWTQFPIVLPAAASFRALDGILFRSLALFVATA